MERELIPNRIKTWESFFNKYQNTNGSQVFVASTREWQDDDETDGTSSFPEDLRTTIDSDWEKHKEHALKGTHTINSIYHNERKLDADHEHSNSENADNSISCNSSSSEDCDDSDNDSYDPDSDESDSLSENSDLVKNRNLSTKGTGTKNYLSKDEDLKSVKHHSPNSDKPDKHTENFMGMEFTDKDFLKALGKTSRERIKGMQLIVRNALSSGLELVDERTPVDKASPEDRSCSAVSRSQRPPKTHSPIKCSRRDKSSGKTKLEENLPDENLSTSNSVLGPTLKHNKSLDTSVSEKLVGLHMNTPSSKKVEGITSHKGVSKNRSTFQFSSSPRSKNNGTKLTYPSTPNDNLKRKISRSPSENCYFSPNKVLKECRFYLSQVDTNKTPSKDNEAKRKRFVKASDSPNTKFFEESETSAVATPSSVRKVSLDSTLLGGKMDSERKLLRKELRGHSLFDL